MPRMKSEVFKLEITVENDVFAFDGRYVEVARILRSAARHIEEKHAAPQYLFDLNGNGVGGSKFVTRRER